MKGNGSHGKITETSGGDSDEFADDFLNDGDLLAAG